MMTPIDETPELHRYLTTALATSPGDNGQPLDERYSLDRRDRGCSRRTRPMFRSDLTGNSSMQRLALSVFLLGVCTIAYANDDLYTVRFSNCMDQADDVPVAMQDCIGEELNTQDARLNGAYRKLRSQLSAKRKTELQAAQRLWIQYRDANCAFYYDPEGGTLHRAMAADCVLRETAERAKELEGLSELNNR